MKKTFTMLLLVVCAGYAHAQLNLDQQVIGSSGQFDSNASIMLSSTFGEMTAVETAGSSSYLLTQGFQQPLPDPFGGVSIPEEHPFPHLIILSPNPASDYLFLNISPGPSQRVILTISDLPGQLIYSAEFMLASNGYSGSVDVSGLATGLYLITVQSDNTHQTQNLKFIKK